MTAFLASFWTYGRFSKTVLLSLPLLLSGFLVHPVASLSPVTISVDCTPNGMLVSQSTTCSAILTDTSTGSPTPPAGSVSWSDAGAAGGGFFDSPGSCQLQTSSPDSSSCTITYTAPSISNSSLAIIGTWSDFTNGSVWSYTFISVLPPIVTSGLAGTAISVDETSRNTIITLTNSSGATVGQVLLPQGSYFPSASTFTISYSSSGGVSRLEVSGVVVPYRPGKTLLIASSASDVCIVDSASGVSFNAPPDCSQTNVLQSIVVLPCNGLSQTFGDTDQPQFPDAPNPRTYTCTPSNGFLRVDGLTHSFIETLELPPVMTIGTSTSLTGDVSARIEIGADGVTLNCNGHTISGVTASSSSPSNNGITLNGRKGVIIENCRIVRFNVGIRMIGSTANLIFQNTASGNGYGFVLSSSNFNGLAGNTANGNLHDGFQLVSSNNNALVSNIANNNGGYGFALISSNNNVIRSNAACGNGLFDGYQETSSGNKFTKNVFCRTKNI